MEDRVFDLDLDLDFDLDSDSGIDEALDALEGEDAEADGYGTEFLPIDPEKIPKMENVVDQETTAYAARPAIVRTRELFDQMKPRRRVLLGMLSACREPCATEKIAHLVRELQSHNHSVYAPANLCTMLEIAGALERVTADGTPYGQTKTAPEIVVMDGVEYYRPVHAATVFWRTTEAGETMLAEDDPNARLDALFEKDERYLAVYKRIFTMAAAAEGTTAAALSAAVDRDPAVQSPRYFVQHFLEALEKCSAIEWRGGAWRLTDAGRYGLRALSGITDDYIVPDDAVPPTAPLSESGSGISW